jgi:hypothetical protein
MSTASAHDELVEKMARAMALAMGMDPDEVQTSGETEWPLWAEFQKPARAALAVARPVIREECARVCQPQPGEAWTVEERALGERLAAAIRATP